MLTYCIIAFQATGGSSRRARLHCRDAYTEGRGDSCVLRRAVNVGDPREGPQRSGGRPHVAHHHPHQGRLGEVQSVADHRAHWLRRR